MVNILDGAGEWKATRTMWRVALSGVGPSLIAFTAKWDDAIEEAMKQAFEAAGLSARIFPLRISNHGAEVCEI